jgi:hypothetical protein
MSRVGGTTYSSAERLTELVYELLDAHVDTMRLADEPADELAWSAHLGYLRALQRVSREALALATAAP